jgi:SpoVK/Ycf46/Vps4 family AAA+-type ATPase
MASNNPGFYVLNLYGKLLQKEFPGVTDFGIAFLADSEDYAESIEPIEEDVGVRLLPREDAVQSGVNLEALTPITIHAHYDYNDNLLDSVILSEVNRCTIQGMKFLKIITPLFVGDSHDIILAPNDKIKDIILAVKQLKDSKINTAIHAPLIDLPLEMLEKDILDFLTNEDFAKFCKQYSIKQKRGFIFSGPPGNGKTLSLAWLKSQAVQRKVEFRAYKSARDFMENQEGDNQNKRILVFEEFDTYLQERKHNEDDDRDQTSGNNVMQSLLQILDGIDDVSNAVFIFTTNFISTFDAAIIRPGRIDKVITFDPPTYESQEKFLTTYLPEYHNGEWILDYLRKKNASISYAILKAIVDNIRIREFWLQQKKVTDTRIGEEDIKEIIDSILSNANRGKGVKNTSEESIL